VTPSSGRRSVPPLARQLITVQRHGSGGGGHIGLSAYGPVRTCTRVYIYIYIYTHTHTFNGPFSGTTRVSRYQKGKTNLESTEARDSEWQRHQLGHMQVCTSLQTTTPAPHHSVLYSVPFLPPNQQCQSTEGKHKYIHRVTVT